MAVGTRHVQKAVLSLVTLTIIIMFLYYFIIILVLCLSIAIGHWYLSMPRHAPPGPFGLPFIGYPVRAKDGLKHYAELVQTYGPVFSYYAGSTLIVVVNGYEAVKQLLVKDGAAFVDRVVNPLAPAILRGNPRTLGLIATNGPLWIEQRRFALSTLRNLGLGKPVLENYIKVEAEYLCEKLLTMQNQPIFLRLHLKAAVANIIFQLTFGERNNYDDGQFKEILTATTIQDDSPNAIIGFAYNRWMWIIPALRRARNNALASGKKVAAYLYAKTRQHLNAFTLDDEPLNYVDAFLREKTLGSGQFFDDEQLWHSVSSLFGAGHESSAGTLLWCIYYCCMYPKIQEAIYEEIVASVGLDRRPSVSDRTRLVYTEATILEAQRLGNVAAIFPRRTVCDINYNGYIVPAGTIVLVNTYSVHTDAAYYPEPQKFSPERFLEDGQVKRLDWFMPFGAGKRVCLGESLARMEMFLFLATLVQVFQFKFATLPEPFQFDDIFRITAQPPPFQVVIQARR